MPSKSHTVTMPYLKLPPTKYSNMKSNINYVHRFLLNSNKFLNTNLSKNYKYIPNKINNISISEMKKILLQQNENICNYNQDYTMSYNHETLMKQKIKKGYFNNAVAIRKEILNKKNRKRKLQAIQGKIPPPKRRKYHNQNNMY